jgi:uncharacterized membrane protein
MNYSTTYVSVIVMILAQVLPKLGIEVGSEMLTTTISTLATIISGLYLVYKRWLRGDVNIFGVRR